MKFITNCFRRNRKVRRGFVAFRIEKNVVQSLVQVNICRSRACFLGEPRFELPHEQFSVNWPRLVDDDIDVARSQIRNADES